jgi:two-component system, LytTR family, sensor kinase
MFNEVCILVTAAFALTLVPGFRQPERSLLSRRDQGTALLVFTILGLIEEATVSSTGLLNERIVAVCAAGLVAGPWVGLAVSVFVTWLAVAHEGSRRARRPAVGLHRNFHVLRWFSRRIAVSVAP